MTVIKTLVRSVPRIWLVAGGGWIGRGLQVVAQLAAVRILSDSLGTTGYGAFAVLGSLVGWFALSDFSIAISLQNHISERRANEREADDIIFTATILSGGAAVSIAICMILAGPWLARMLLGEFGSLSAMDRTLAFYAMAFPGIGAALGGVAYKIWFAQHRGYLSNLVPAAGTMLGTLAVWAVAHLSIRSRLPWSVFFYYAPIALLPMIALAWMAWRTKHHRFRTDLVMPLLQRAFRFWIFGLLAAAVLQVDYIIMAKVLPARDIVIYNVATKLFQLVFFVYNALLLALWPVCSEAIMQDDWPRVMAIVKKYLMIGIAFVIACGTLIAVFNPIIVRIIAPSLSSPLPINIIALLTLYIVVRVWADTFAIVLQSMNDLSIFWIAVPFQSVLSIGLQVFGAHVFGLKGMIIGLISCFILTVAWILPLRCLSHARGRVISS